MRGRNSLHDPAQSSPDNAPGRAIGRKNCLFANTPAGARASANLYGLIDTAKANAVEPYRYLAHVFTELPQRDLDAGDPVDDLLSWKLELPDRSDQREILTARPPLMCVGCDAH